MNIRNLIFIGCMLVGSQNYAQQNSTSIQDIPTIDDALAKFGFSEQ